MIEIDLKGGHFTWEKSRGSNDWVKERLDRAFASRSWLNSFSLCKLSVIHTSVSDHDPIMLDLFSMAFTGKNFTSVLKIRGCKRRIFTEKRLSIGSLFLRLILFLSLSLCQTSWPVGEERFS